MTIDVKKGSSYLSTVIRTDSTTKSLSANPILTAANPCRCLPMDKEIHIKFESLEKALSALVDSISKYNPSVAATNELVEAERNLSEGLERGVQFRGRKLTVCPLHEVLN